MFHPTNSFDDDCLLTTLNRANCCLGHCTELIFLLTTWSRSKCNIDAMYISFIYFIWQRLISAGNLCLLPLTPRTCSAPTEKFSEIETAINDGLMDVRGKIDDISRSVSDYFPMIKRGFIGEEKEDGAPEVVTVGWKHDVTSRKEREEGLR